MASRRPLAVTLLAAVLVAGGCSKASQTGADDPVVSAPAPSSPAPVTASSTPSASASAATSTAAPASSPTSAKPSTPAPSSAAGLPDGPGGCPTRSLKIAALRASGAAGHQYAFLQFTNTGTTSCSLTGFPGVQLLRAGRPLGQPAVRSALPAVRVQLAPGAAVTARLVDDSTCQADNSDSVQVIAPNRTEKFVLPLALRGCTVHVDPVAAS